MPRLTDEQKNFIIAHSTLEGWGDSKIAQELNIPRSTVIRFRQRQGVGKSFKGVKGKVNPKDVVKPPETLKMAENDDQRRAYYRQMLLRSPRSLRLAKMFDDEDFEFFLERWIEYHIQFPDMSASEEDNLEKLIIVDLRIAYNAKSMKECLKIQNELRESLNAKGKLDPENDRDLQIIHTINSQNGQEQALNAELTKLTKEYSDILEAMNGTRQQREASQKVGATTFFDLIQKFNQEEVRREVGRYNELVRKSKEKKLNDLMQPHKYIDGNYDLPILDGAEVKRLKELEDKNKSNE